MIKNIILFLMLIFCFQSVYGVCYVGKAVPISEIKAQIEKQLNPLIDYIYFKQTPTGFIISFNNDIIFDDCNEINVTGKLLLIQMAQVIKNSGYKWQIYCHSDKFPTQIDRISNTTEQAVKIKYFLTDVEKCLLNQLVPIGFGSIMPMKNLPEKHSQNRVDFIVENFDFSRQ